MADRKESHPVGTGAGVGGAVVGGLVGKGIAEAVDAKQEEEYWRANYRTCRYYVVGESYELYEPAYRYGWESYTTYYPRKYEEVEPELESGWDRFKGAGKLTWAKAKRFSAR